MLSASSERNVPVDVFRVLHLLILVEKGQPLARRVLEQHESREAHEVDSGAGESAILHVELHAGRAGHVVDQWIVALFPIEEPLYEVLAPGTNHPFLATTRLRRDRWP